MRLVFDTNVYISAFVMPGSKSDLAFRLAVRRAFELAVSAEILMEVREKLGSKFGLSEAEIGRVEQVIMGSATSVEPETELRGCRDHDRRRPAVQLPRIGSGTQAGDDLRSYMSLRIERIFLE